MALILLGLGLVGQDLSQPGDLSQQGAAAMKAGRFADAEKAFRQLVKQSPKTAGWQGNLGLALYSQGRYTDAIEPLDQSVRLQSNSGLSRVLASCYIKTKRYADGAAVLERLGQKREAAQAWWQARQYDRAIPLFRAIETQFESDAGFHYEYGDSLARADGPQAAIPHLEKAASLIEGRAALGKALVELGRFADAVPHLEAAAQVDPDLLLPLSRAYKQTGRAAEGDRALSDYRKRQSQN